MTDEERSEALGHAHVRCTSCQGAGTRIIRHGREVFCNCAYRGLFHEVMSRYHRAADQVSSLRAILFRADVDITVRVLSAECQILWKLFHAQGATWEECLTHPQLRHLDRGAFFHAVYSTERVLGKELLKREIAPCWKYFDWGHAPILAKPDVGKSLYKAPNTLNWTNWQQESRPDFNVTGTTNFNGRQRASAA